MKETGDQAWIVENDWLTIIAVFILHHDVCCLWQLNIYRVGWERNVAYRKIQTLVREHPTESVGTVWGRTAGQTAWQTAQKACRIWMH